MFRLIDKLRNLYGKFKALFKKQKITVIVNGKECKVLGQIGMHHTTIDITDIEAEIGCPVKMEVKPIYVQSKVRREYR